MNYKTFSYQDFSWTDIENPTGTELEKLRANFEIDQNFLKDALEVGHLPKMERTKDYVFLILRAYTPIDNENVIEVREISNKIAFFIHERELITLHQAPFEFLNKPPDDIKTIDGIVLFLINEILMTYENSILRQAEKMDQLEQTIFLKGGNNLSLEKLYYEKSKARLIKKILQITQNVINQIHVPDELNSTLQDLKDTVLDFILKTEEVVEDSNALLNSYMTYTAQKSNDIMKLLTIFSAFFLPLTFIVGVYGMNFTNMPELEWKYGYFYTLALMLAIAAGIFIWFKNKRII